MFVSQPLAGLAEAFAKYLHSQVDDSSVGIAYETLEGVATDAEGKGGVAVVVKRTEGFVTLHLEPEPFGNGLDRELTQSLNIIAFHISSFWCTTLPVCQAGE